MTWIASGQRSELLVINGPEDLDDIRIVGSTVEPYATPTPVANGPIDPAILSYGRPAGPAQTQTHSKPTALAEGSTPEPAPFPSVPIHSKPQAHQTPLPTPVVPRQTLPNPDTSTANQDPGTSATLTGPFTELTLSGQAGAGDEELSNYKDSVGGKDMLQKTKKRKQRRGTTKEMTAKADATPAPARVKILQREPQAPIPNIGKENAKPTNSGWRETPFLEETLPAKAQSLRPPNGSKRTKRRRRPQKEVAQDQNGWATEEATDIQEMGDFDFSGNLSKFDKRGVFHQFKQEDTTADEQRLVTHNRLPPKPGTAGGKNLHYTENVLDSPKCDHTVTWSSNDSEDDRSKAKVGSDRSSRRNMSRTSRASANPTASRKSSLMANEQYTTGSGSLPESKARARWTPQDSAEYTTFQRDVSSSPDTIKRTTLFADSARSRLPSSAQTKPSLRLVASDQICHCLTPLQILELEQLAISELGLSEEILTENAARAIAETAIRLAELAEETTDPGKPTKFLNLVVLAGNNKSGARAIGGARHLLNHGARVFTAVLGLEREDDLLDSMRQQIAMFRKCGGQVTRPDRLSKALKNGRVPVDLIVDALLGIHMSFDDMRTDDQATYFGLLNWANKKPPVLAIDVPSGLNASSGKLFITLIQIESN